MKTYILVLSALSLFSGAVAEETKDELKEARVLKFIPEAMVSKGSKAERATMYEFVEQGGDRAFIAYYSDSITATVVSADQYMQQCVINVNTCEVEITENWSFDEYNGKEMILHQYEKIDVYTDPQFISQEMVLYW